MKQTFESAMVRLEEISEILEENPEIASINSNVKRSDMYR